MATNTPLDRFKADLAAPDLIARLRAGIIGEGVPVPGPKGTHPLVYADYVASGRALRQVEDFVMTEVLPYYANSHTEASFCGGAMTALRRAARAEIARIVGAGPEHAVIFTGSGATSALNRLVDLFGLPDLVRDGAAPLVVLGPYEHHSNILPWRESGAEVVEVSEAAKGGPDLDALRRILDGADGRPVIGAFSAASNVTGIVTDPAPVTRLLKSRGARVVWDYAGGGPYLPVSMTTTAGDAIDALVVSPHKFLGGPAASGLLVLRRDAAMRARPVWAGGGTVRFVSPWAHDYSTDIVAREEAGTPNVIGDVRAALAFLVKESMGQEMLNARHAALRARALAVWQKNPMIDIMGNPRARDVLPIFSLRIRDGQRGGHIHQQLVTRMLSDLYGIQARGGCACAGPYAHRLLGIGQTESETLRTAILSGNEMLKPGWTRLNFSALMTDEKADFIISAVDALARAPHPLCDHYSCDTATARFQAEAEEIA